MKVLFIIIVTLALLGVGVPKERFVVKLTYISYPASMIDAEGNLKNEQR